MIVSFSVIVTLYLTVCTIPHTCYEPNTDPRLVLGIDVGELVEKIRATTSTGTTIIKYQLEHCGVPVLGCSAILEVASDGKCRIQDSNITPEKVEMLPRECAERHGLSNMQLLEKVSSEENDNVDLERVKEQYDACSFWLYRENPKEVRSIVYLKYISGGFTGDGGPKRKSFQVDVNTYEILKREVVDVSFAYEMTGIGGNLNLGKHQYGNWEWSGRKLLVDRPDADGLYCNMENHYLAVADAGGTGNCDYNDTYVDLCNSYSMLNSHSYNQVNDVLFYSTNFLDMLKDDYFDTTLPAACGQMYTCVNIDFDNAFYGSCEQFYGSGKTYFWGLGSADVVAHELCHGVTQFTSNLVYSQETGGMNEAFSDMCGITYKTYLNHGHNDWKVGYGIIKDYLGLDALRFMDWPPADGVSIQCQADYYDGMDVHYSSGLYNKVFYLLATTPGWSEKKAFQVFLRANQFYWTYVSSFNEAACGVLLAASTFSYSVEDVEEAFAAVGIFCGTLFFTLRNRCNIHHYYSYNYTFVIT